MKFTINFNFLGILFIILKLTHVISWSWLWVLSPFWLGLLFMILMWTVMCVVAFLALGFAIVTR